MSLRERSSQTGVDGSPVAPKHALSAKHALTLSQTFTPRQEAKGRALSITSATGFVIGSIVGTGVFTMPAVLVRQMAWFQNVSVFLKRGGRSGPPPAAETAPASE